MATQSSPSLPPQQPAQPVKAFSQPLMWLVVGIPAVTVVAGLCTLWIAIEHADRPIATDYVKQGMAVSTDTRRERHAVELGVAGTLDMQMTDNDTLQVRLLMTPPAPARLTGTAAATPAVATRTDAGSAPASATASTGGSTPAGAPLPVPQKLRLLHPSDPGNDITLFLLPDGQNRWQARQPVTWAPGTRWHIALEGSDWRLPLAGLQTVEALQHFDFDARLAAAQANEPKPGEQSASDPARRKAGTGPSPANTTGGFAGSESSAASTGSAASAGSAGSAGSAASASAAGAPSDGSGEPSGH